MLEVGHTYADVGGGMRMHALMSRPRVDTVLVHGVGGSAWTFEAMLRQRPPSPAWASVDLLGYGESSWAPDGEYSSALEADAVGGFLDQAAVPQSHLVGFSWGGLIALEVARRRRDVTKLVLIDIAPSSTARDTDVRPIPARYADLAAVQRAVRTLAPRASTEVVAAEAAHSTSPAVGGGYTKKIDPSLLRRWPFRSEDHWPALEEVRAEVLVVRAAESPVLSARTAQEMVARARSASLVTIAGSGHLLPLERPAELAGVIADFLAA